MFCNGHSIRLMKLGEVYRKDHNFLESTKGKLDCFWFEKQILMLSVCYVFRKRVLHTTYNGQALFS